MISLIRRFFGYTVIDALGLIKGSWSIDGNAVTASAAQLNSAGTVADKAVTASKLGNVAKSPSIVGGNGTPLVFNLNTYHLLHVYCPGINGTLATNGSLPTDRLVSVIKFDFVAGLTDVTSNFTIGTNKITHVSDASINGYSIVVTWIDIT